MVRYVLKLVITSVLGHSNRAVFCPISTDSASSRWRSSVRPLETSKFTRRRTRDFCNNLFSLIASVINEINRVILLKYYSTFGILLC